MARCPLVRPETVRVSLSGGDWIDLAKELTAGEYRDMIAAQFKDSPIGDRPSLDMRQVGLSRILAYVKDWSFVDQKDAPLPVSGDWLLKFDQQTFGEVLDAVNAHDKACDLAAEARKNDLADATKS